MISMGFYAIVFQFINNIVNCNVPKKLIKFLVKFRPFNFDSLISKYVCRCIAGTTLTKNVMRQTILIKTTAIILTFSVSCLYLFLNILMIQLSE